MRIALDATYSVDPQPSGIAVYSQELIRGLIAGYPQDHFVCCYRAKQFRNSLRPSSKNASRRLLLPPLPTFRVDVFHSLNQRVDRRPAKRVVSTFHDLFVITGEYSSTDFRKRFTDQARQAALKSDLIIAVSEFTASQVNTLLGVERGRIRVVPHGVEAVMASPESEREKLILFVGALQARKNIKRLVEAFEELPVEWRLVLAGAPSGFQASEILDRVEGSRSRKRIEVTGYVSRKELDQLFRRASIFAFPSLDEGFGIPVLEAMARGVPVVTSKGSALAEMAEGAAVLVSPDNTEELAHALGRIAQSGALRKQLAEAGRLRAANYTWERSVRETYAIYRELAR